jgi:glucose-1-phosphate adenylyltransferase
MRTLLKALQEDAADEAGSHDFGRDILPRMVSEQQAIYAYDFQTM